jgi:hypothetical protein
VSDDQRTGTDSYQSLRALLAETARAHHDAMGDAEDDWAAWYAGYLQGKLDAFVGFSPDPEVTRRWLADADERYRAQSLEEPWPVAYARWILDDYAPNHGR